MPLRKCFRRMNGEQCPNVVEWVYVGLEEGDSRAFCAEHGREAQHAGVLRPGMWFKRAHESELHPVRQRTAAQRIHSEHQQGGVL